MKTLLSSRPVLWFLFLFNLAVAVAVGVGVGLDGTQQVLTSAGMGAVALGAGAALVRRPSGLTRAGSPTQPQQLQKGESPWPPR